MTTADPGEEGLGETPQIPDAEHRGTSDGRSGSIGSDEQAECFSRLTLRVQLLVRLLEQRSHPHGTLTDCALAWRKGRQEGSLENGQRVLVVVWQPLSRVHPALSDDGRVQVHGTEPSGRSQEEVPVLSSREPFVPSSDRTQVLGSEHHLTRTGDPPTKHDWPELSSVWSPHMRDPFAIAVVVELDPCTAGSNQIAMVPQRLDQHLEGSSPESVIIVQEDDVFPYGRLETSVARRSSMHIPVQPQHPDARIFDAAEPIRSAILGRVVHDQQLPPSERLSSYGRNRFLKVCESISGRDHNRDMHVRRSVRRYREFLAWSRHRAGGYRPSTVDGVRPSGPTTM